MIKGINHITLAVSDVDRSFEFYRRILGLKPIVKGKFGAYLTAGDIWVALSQDDSVKKAKKPDYSHIAFTCSNDAFIQLKTKLMDYGCQEWSENTSEGDSFYFQDPDGHKFEIHVGNLQTRLEAMKSEPWEGIVYY